MGENKGMTEKFIHFIVKKISQFQFEVIFLKSIKCVFNYINIFQLLLLCNIFDI